MTIKDYSEIFYPHEMRKEKEDHSLLLGAIVAALIVVGIVWLVIEPTEAEAQNGYATSTSPTAKIVRSAIAFCDQAIADHAGEELPESIKEVCL